MREFRRLKSSQTIVLLAVAISLLLLLLVPHGAGDLSYALISLTLLPVFLFCCVESIQEDLPAYLVLLVAPAARPSLFQRPPPALQS